MFTKQVERGENPLPLKPTLLTVPMKQPLKIAKTRSFLDGEETHL